MNKLEMMISIFGERIAPKMALLTFALLCAFVIKCFVELFG